MMQKMADGRFAEAIAAEGGMPAVLWAGDLRKDEPRRVIWNLNHAEFEFALECGLIPAAPDPLNSSRFKTDPDIKLETLHYTAKSRLMARRKGPSIELRSPEGKMELSPLPFHAPESMLSEVRDALSYPALTAVRETFLAWRFYHQFRTDPDSPMRRAQVGFWSPVLAHDGGNLAAALQSIRESGKGAQLDAILDSAFPETTWETVDGQGRFQLRLARPHVKRSFDASELSDGTLRFFCLCAALLTEKLPPFLVLNEPETSLHEDLLPPLADLIAAVPETTQMLVVTHSRTLGDLVTERREARKVELVNYRGETRSAEQATGKRVWVFGE